MATLARSHPSVTPQRVCPTGRPLSLVDADHEIVHRIRAGDEIEFTRLFRSYHAPLCDYAFRIVGDASTAEDLVQAALFSIWRHRQRWQLRVGGTLRAYLYACVRNVALQHRNHERVVHRVHDASAQFGRPLAMGCGDRCADDAVAMRDLEAAFAAALADLPPRCREAFVLRRGAGLSVADIARVMGIAPKTVEVQIGAALRTLRAALREWTGWSPARSRVDPSRAIDAGSMRRG